ncbi:MAG: hypothetical protein WB697_04065 [Stellaceae bacterium]
MGRTMKRVALTLVVIGAGAYAAMNPGVVNAFYHGVYPDDPAKQQALELCFMQDHTFNRLDASARDACYSRMLQPLGEVTASGRPNVNMVDLQRAAAQGSMPRNDIIRLQESRNASHPPH